MNPPIPTPPGIEATLAQALYEGYLEPVKQLQERKARYWEMLAEQDRFSLSNHENQRLQRRMDALADEIQVLDNLLHAVQHLADLYFRHIEEVQNDRDRYRTWYRIASKNESTLINILQLEIQAAP